MKFHLVSAHFGGKPPWKHKLISKVNDVSTNYYHDNNTPPRHLSMHPRLKSKIPKMLEWKLVDSDWYIWADSSIRLNDIDITEIIKETAKDNPLCLFKHTKASSIAEEVNSVRAQIKVKNKYFTQRYEGEPLINQLAYYYGDPDFIDDKLFSMTFFAYKREAISLMKEWFIHNTIWSIEDQISFPYLLQKSGLNYSLFEGSVSTNKTMFNWQWKDRENYLNVNY